MLPTSSVAMTTYNGEKYLQRQLDSLAEQTVLPDELVVCDDGSTDGTMEILHRFAQTAPFPVRIFQNEKNLGICANFCKAFSLCEKEVAFFSDQDDIWFPQKLEKVLKVMEAKPDVGLVVTYDQRVDANEKPLWRIDPFPSLTPYLQEENSYRTLFRRNYLAWSTHNMACRTRWRKVLLKDEHHVCFDNVIFHFMGIWDKLHVITEPCCAFRRHGKNATSHSQGRKNPLVLLYRAIKRHQDIHLLFGRYQTWQEIISFSPGAKFSPTCPEAFSYYQQRAEHLRSRMEIIAHFWKRPWLMIRELSTGRYFRCSNKGLRDILSDLFAWQQKLPKELEAKG